MYRVNSQRPIEELVGANYGIVRQRLGNVHCMSGALAAARAARPRGMRGVPVPLRRGWAKCVLDTLAENRDLYLRVVRGSL